MAAGRGLLTRDTVYDLHGSYGLRLTEAQWFVLDDAFGPQLLEGLAGDPDLGEHLLDVLAERGADPARRAGRLAQLRHDPGHVDRLIAGHGGLLDHAAGAVVRIVIDVFRRIDAPARHVGGAERREHLLDVAL